MISLLTRIRLRNTWDWLLASHRGLHRVVAAIAALILRIVHAHVGAAVGYAAKRRFLLMPRGRRSVKIIIVLSILLLRRPLKPTTRM